MDSPQFYEGPPKKKFLATRRKRIHPLQGEIDGKKNQAAGTPTSSKNETDEVQLQFDVPRIAYTKEARSATLAHHLDLACSYSTGSISPQTLTHGRVSSASDFASNITSCSELLGKENTEMGRSIGVGSNSETSDSSVEHSASELASSHAIGSCNSSRQSHDYVEHTIEEHTLSMEAKNAECLMSRPGITLPRRESNHPLLSHPSIASCEACSFKEGQIFALVQILHSFHRGQLQAQMAKITLKSQKRLPKGRPASTSSPNRIRTTAQAGRTKVHQIAPSSDTASNKTERDTNHPPMRQAQSHTRLCTRSGRVSKATQKILYPAF